ncbi:hypothetical protein EV182_002373, partial [Spiromyces aspiralis]
MDIGIPGSMPRLNPKCIHKAIATILALHGKVQPRSSFDRKSYFYPDQPLGFQITQHYHPIGVGGHLDLGEDDGLEYERRIGIRQIQLEQASELPTRRP